MRYARESTVDDGLDLLTLRLHQERLPDHWLEDLEPEDPRAALSGVRRQDGGRPKWMKEGPEIRDRIRTALPEILAATAKAQEHELNLLALIPGSRSPSAVQVEGWTYEGVTRVGDTLELWFAAADWYAFSVGTLRMTYDILIVRAPLTNPHLRGAVLDRVEWLNRPVFELPPKS